MRRFGFNVFLFLLLQALGFAFLLQNYDVSRETNFFARIVEKHERLAATPPPRIILLGGSNVPFGFESDVMEQALGRPVVNMGLAAGLGVEFMLADLEPELRRGDVVVLSLEYDHFARGAGHGGGFDPSVLQQVLIFRPKGFLALRPIHFRKIILDRGLTLLGEIARHGLRIGHPVKRGDLPEERSARAGFNEWGDLVGHRKEPSRISRETLEATPLVVRQPDFPNKALLRAIRDFVQRCERREIRVAYTFPPKPIATLRRDAAQAQQVEAALRRIPDLILLDSPQDHAYAADQFFDTANHLTAAGAAMRTAKVTAALRRALQLPALVPSQEVRFAPLTRDH
jgi:hypothetical protein